MAAKRWEIEAEGPSKQEGISILRNRCQNRRAEAGTLAEGRYRLSEGENAGEGILEGARMEGAAGSS